MLRRHTGSPFGLYFATAFATQKSGVSGLSGGAAQKDNPLDSRPHQAVRAILSSARNPPVIVL
jgi:hypothetical protein